MGGGRRQNVITSARGAARPGTPAPVAVSPHLSMCGHWAVFTVLQYIAIHVLLGSVAPRGPLADVLEHGSSALCMHREPWWIAFSQEYTNM